MGEKIVVQRGGVSFAGLLAILFIGLKLAGIAPVATWSWWWVLSPLWIGLAFFLGAIALVAVVGLFVLLLKLIFGR